jgi:hypothetical protein
MTGFSLLFVAGFWHQARYFQLSGQQNFYDESVLIIEEE